MDIRRFFNRQFEEDVEETQASSSVNHQSSGAAPTIQTVANQGGSDSALTAAEPSSEDLGIDKPAQVTLKIFLKRVFSGKKQIVQQRLVRKQRLAGILSEKRRCILFPLLQIPPSLLVHRLDLHAEWVL